MPQVSPASTPRVTVQVPVPTPVQAPPKKPKAQAQPQAQPQAAPPQQPAYPPPPWVRPQEPEFSPRQFVEAHSLILPFAPPPKPRFRPPAGLKFGRRRYNRAFAAGIAQAGEDEMPSLAFADWLAENGHSGAEEVVRRGLEHRRHLRGTDHRLILSYPGAVDVWPEHWIREDTVQAMDQHPHGMRAWAYPARAYPVNSGQRGHWQVAFSVLSHPTAVRYPDDSRSGGRGEPVPGRHVVQYHTGPVPAADAHRLLGTMAHEGVPGAGEGWRQVLQAHPDLARPERMSRPVRYGRGDWAGHLRALASINNLRDPLPHLVLADRLEEDGLPGVAQIIRRHVERVGNERAASPSGRPIPAVGTPTGGPIGITGIPYPQVEVGRPFLATNAGRYSNAPYPTVAVGFNLPRRRPIWYHTRLHPEDAHRVAEESRGQGVVAANLVARSLRETYGDQLVYTPTPGYGSNHRITARGPASYRHADVDAWLGRRDSRRLRDNLRADRNPDGSITWTLYWTPIVTAHPDDTFTIHSHGYMTPTTARNVRRLSPGAMGQARDGDARVDVAGNRIDDPPERMTRKLTRREKIARRRGRLIKREVASGRHPDRQTAVLAALALSIKADEA